MVDNVECFHAKLKSRSFSQFRALGEPYVHLPNVWRSDKTTGRVPKMRDDSVSIHWGHCKGVDVDPIVPVLPRGDDRNARYQVGSLVGYRLAVGNLTGIQTDQRGQRVACMPQSGPAQAPAFQDFAKNARMVQEFTSRANREFINARGNKVVPDIEHTGTS